MKKIALGLIALTALSTASFAAGNHSSDPGDGTYFNAPTSRAVSNTAVSGEAALAVESQAGANAIDEMLLRSEQRR